MTLASFCTGADGSNAMKAGMLDDTNGLRLNRALSA